MKSISFSGSNWKTHKNQQKLFDEINPVAGTLVIDSTAKALKCSLPMYDNAHLICITSDQWQNENKRICYLKMGDELHWLNGTSPPIHTVNSKAPIKLNDENVLFYLSFFCFFVHAEEGPFFLINSMDDKLLPKGFSSAVSIDTPAQKLFNEFFSPPKIWGKNDDNHWRVSAYIYYGNEISQADFLIQPSGKIEMVHSRVLITGLLDGVKVQLD